MRYSTRHLVTGSIALVAISMAGCAPFLHSPSTLGDPRNAPVYGYTPIDPLDAYPPGEQHDSTCHISKDRILGALPDVTYRYAVGQASDSGHVRYGPATIGTAGNSYVVVIDYTQSQTRPLALAVKTDTSFVVLDTAHARAFAGSPDSTRSSGARLAIVPIYLGVGVRLTASVTVRSGTVDLGNLVAIGAAAQASQVSGTLVVQTLGIRGPAVAATLPMLSDINTSTIQSMIQAMGVIKTKLYDDSTAKPWIRILGFYNNLGGGQATVSRFISSALTNPPKFYLPGCIATPK